MQKLEKIGLAYTAVNNEERVRREIAVVEREKREERETERERKGKGTV